MSSGSSDPAAAGDWSRITGTRGRRPGRGGAEGGPVSSSSARRLRQAGRSGPRSSQETVECFATRRVSRAWRGVMPESAGTGSSHHRRSIRSIQSSTTARTAGSSKGSPSGAEGAVPGEVDLWRSTGRRSSDAIRAPSTAASSAERARSIRASLIASTSSRVPSSRKVLEAGGYDLRNDARFAPTLLRSRDPGYEPLKAQKHGVTDSGRLVSLPPSAKSSPATYRQNEKPMWAPGTCALPLGSAPSMPPVASGTM